MGHREGVSMGIGFGSGNGVEGEVVEEGWDVILLGRTLVLGLLGAGSKTGGTWVGRGFRGGKEAMSNDSHGSGRRGRANGGRGEGHGKKLFEWKQLDSSIPSSSYDLFPWTWRAWSDRRATCCYCGWCWCWCWCRCLCWCWCYCKSRKQTTRMVVMVVGVQLCSVLGSA